MIADTICLNTLHQPRHISHSRTSPRRLHWGPTREVRTINGMACLSLLYRALHAAADVSSVARFVNGPSPPECMMYFVDGSPRMCPILAA
jgi:hypothetical protein